MFSFALTLHTDLYFPNIFIWIPAVDTYAKISDTIPAEEYKTYIKLMPEVSQNDMIEPLHDERISWGPVDCPLVTQSSSESYTSIKYVGTLLTINDLTGDSSDDEKLWRNMDWIQ